MHPQSKGGGKNYIMLESKVMLDGTIDKFMCGKRVTKNVAHRICDLFAIDKSLFCVRDN